MKWQHKIVVAGLLGLLAAAPGFAAEHEVQMLNRGESGTMVFEPAFVKAEPGDVIKFVPTSSGHNVESIDGMLPEGVEHFKSAFSVPYELTVTEEGVYGIKCTPHLAMGMVMLVQVGDAASNLEAAKAVEVPKKAQARFDDAFAKVQ
jgi:pseudoazurin